MSDTRSNEIALSALTACLGAFGVVAFVFAYPVLGWIGMAGFVVMLIWMILTAPAKPRGKGDGSSAAFWGMSGGDSKGDSGGGAGGGDGGGGAG